METLIIHPRTAKEQATVEAILKALDVPFHKQNEGFDPTLSAKTAKADMTGIRDENSWKLE